MIPDKCLIASNEETIVCSQKWQPKRRMMFKNSNRSLVQIICVDDCIPLKGVKCDKLVRSPKKCSNFVELKGRNVEEAVNQLSNTILQLRPFLGNEKMRAFIICNESPSVTQAQRFKPRFEKNNGAELIIRTHFYKASVY